MKEFFGEISKKGMDSQLGEINVQISPENLLIKDAIFVRHEKNLVKVKYEDILWIKGDGNYTTVVTRNSVFSVRNILKDFELALPVDRFMRIHKSYMVQIAEINSINTREVKVGPDLVPVGRSYYHDLINGIQKIGHYPH